MPASKKIACGGLALLLCTSGAGCAGSRLANVFSLNPTSSYKSIEELEAEEKKQAALRDRAVASTKPSDNEAASEATTHAFSGLFARMTGRSRPESDPFLEMENQTKTATSEAEHLADIERRLAEEKRSLETLRQEQLAKTATVPANTRTASATISDDNPFDQALKADLGSSAGLFANLSAESSAVPAAAAKPAAPGRQEKSATRAEFDDDVFAALSAQAESRQLAAEAKPAQPAAPVIQSSDTSPADALEALLARSAPAGSRTNPGLSESAALSTAAVGELDAFAARELASDRTDADRAMPLRAGRGPASGNQPANRPGQSTPTAFDSLLTQSPPTGGLTGNGAGRLLQRNPRQPESSATTETRGRMRAAAGDVFAAVSYQQGAPLTDASGFNWKDVTDLSVPAPEPTSSWWNTADASRSGQGSSDKPPVVLGNESSSDWAGVSTANSNFGPGPSSMVASLQAPPVLPGLKPAAESGLLQTPGIQTASLSSSSVIVGGFEEDPFFSQAADASQMSDDANVQLHATDDTPVLQASGFLSGLQGRTWALLLGGIIVVVLLFAPGRSKSNQS